jgi:tetratricopeptide (TPR) repeat protein
VRILVALACAAGAFQLAGCPLGRLNEEMKREVDAGLDRALGVERLSPDQRAIRDAAAAIDRGDYLEAETLLEAALQINPTSSAAKLNLAAVYEATGRTRQAAELYASLIRTAGEAPVALDGDLRLNDADAARIASHRLQRLKDPRWVQPARELPAEAGPRPLARIEAEPVAPKQAGEPGTVELTMAEPAPGVPARKPLIVTLASFATEAAAAEGWEKLHAAHGALFGDHEPIIAPVERGPGKGTAYRLATGPFASAREAAAFCETLLARKVYCVIAG